jgi:predicted membrane protein
MREHSHREFFSNTSIFWGLIIIIIGILFLLNNLDAFDLGDFIADFWPVILILIGLRLMLRRKHDEKMTSHIAGDKDIVSESNEAFYSNVFGDFDVAINSKDFQSGKINNVFGDVEVDLTNLNITSGEKKLHVSGVFGDIKVAAPKNVPFFIRASIVAGDIKMMGEKRSGFSVEKTYKSDGYDTAENRLNIYVSHVFGDIKVW